MDRHQRARPGHAGDADRRGRVLPLPLGHERRTRCGAPRFCRARSRRAIADRTAFIEDVRRALYCSKMISYAQGYMLLREAAKEESWNLNFGGIALMWRGGCIIRSRFLGKIKEAYDKNPQLEQLAAGRVLQHDVDRVTRRPGARHRAGDRVRRADPGVLHGAGVFRRLPHARACRPTCCRPSATTSARTRMSAWTGRAASSSTPTGPGAAAGSRRYTFSGADVARAVGAARVDLSDAGWSESQGEGHEIRSEYQAQRRAGSGQPGRAGASPRHRRDPLPQGAPVPHPRQRRRVQRRREPGRLLPPATGVARRWSIIRSAT